MPEREENEPHFAATAGMAIFGPLWGITFKYFSDFHNLCQQKRTQFIMFEKRLVSKVSVISEARFAVNRG